MRRSRIACCMVAAVVLFATTACAGARPWERAALSKPMMQMTPDPEAALLEQHVYDYREGSVGGFSGGGGGCGCN